MCTRNRQEIRSPIISFFYRSTWLWKKLCEHLTAMSASLSNRAEEMEVDNTDDIMKVD